MAERASVVDVGHIAVSPHTTDESLVRLLERRFRRFLNPSADPAFQFDITVVQRGSGISTPICTSTARTADGRCSAATSTRSGMSPSRAAKSGRR